MKKLIPLLFLSLTLLAIPAKGQEWAISTNILDYANLGTVNGQASLALSQKFSIEAGARFNDWKSISVANRDFKNNKQAYYTGFRFWPWHVYSGWWFQTKAQYMEYSSGGILSQHLQEGDAYGGGLSFGYTYMLTSTFNIEFGAGLWGGKRIYNTYAATNMGKPIGEGDGLFIAPDNIEISLLLSFGGKKRYRYSRYYMKTQKRIEKERQSQEDNL